jgi:hypothetical protein
MRRQSVAKKEQRNDQRTSEFLLSIAEFVVEQLFFVRVHFKFDLLISTFLRSSTDSAQLQFLGSIFQTPIVYTTFSFRMIVATLRSVGDNYRRTSSSDYR